MRLGVPGVVGFWGVAFRALLSLQLWIFLHRPSDPPPPWASWHPGWGGCGHADCIRHLWGQRGFVTMGEAQILGHKETFPTGLLPRFFRKQSRGTDLREECALLPRSGARR